MHELHDVAAQRYPLPLARRIAERVQAIPGWFSEEEAELLIALVIRAVTRWGSNDSPRLVEIGSFCGRATVAMGLTLQGLGRADIRIVSVDEPTLGPAPDGRPPREVLHAHLAAHGLKELVMCAPEEDPLPWGQTSRLILVDGQHDYLSVRSDVERYVPGLSHEGFLLFHDYADYFPDVQRAVEELLVQPNFEFVAQAGSLIALMRCSESPLSSGH